MKTKQKSLDEGSTKHTTTNTTEAAANSSAHTRPIVDIVEGNSTNSIAETNGSLAFLPPEVAKIRKMHSELRDTARTSLKKAIHIGELLTKLKQECGHGKWDAFIGDHLKLEARTVQNYMRLYREKDRFKNEIVSDLPLSKAYLILRQPISMPLQPGTTPSHAPLTMPKMDMPVPDTKIHEPDESPECQHPAMDVTASVDGGTETAHAFIPAVASDEAPAGNKDEQLRAAITPIAPLAGVVSTFPTIGKTRHIAEQFDFNFASAPTLIVDGWQDGLIGEQRVRDELGSLAENPKGNSPHDVEETQRLTVQFAGFINSIVPTNATAATLSNLRHSFDWLTRLITILIRTKLGV